jgi:hypothetical protein
MDKPLKIRVVKGMIPDRISYPHPHFPLSFASTYAKRGWKTPAKAILFTSLLKSTIFVEFLLGDADAFVSKSTLMFCSVIFLTSYRMSHARNMKVTLQII